MNKKYYWLKLKNDFFTDKRIKKLRKIAGGDTYTVIYLKMQLLSLQDDGYLYFENVEETFEEEIALQIDEDIEDVKITIAFLFRNNLIAQDGYRYELVETRQCIGSETRNAESMRKLRKERKNVTMLQDVTKCYIEKEKEKEIEIEKDNIYSPVKEQDKIPYEEIIEYLNFKTNSHYKTTTRKTRDLIKARFNEKFTLEDFKKVIDNKTNDWLNDKKMSEYLRPETLFGNKFEGYLNQPTKEVTIDNLQSIGIIDF